MIFMKTLPLFSSLFGRQKDARVPYVDVNMGTDHNRGVPATNWPKRLTPWSSLVPPFGTDGPILAPGSWTKRAIKVKGVHVLTIFLQHRSVAFFQLTVNSTISH